MQLLIFIAAIGFFVLRILASSKKKQPETAENGAANRFAENESDDFKPSERVLRRGNRSLPHRTEPRAGHTVHPTPIAARQTAPAAAFTKALMRAKFALRAPRPELAAETCAAMHPPAKKPQQAKRQRKLRHGSPPPQSDPMTIPHMSKNNRLKAQKKCRAERTGCLKPSRLSPQLPRALSGMRFFPHPLRQEIRIDTADF